MNSLVDISAAEQKLAERVNGGIMGALAISDRAGGVQFANASEVMEFSKLMALANSGVRKHLRGNPGACLAICVQAVEWGMSPFAVANKSYFVNDQIAFESQMVQAVILKRAPIKGRIKFEYSGDGQDRRCRASARLRDDPDEIVDYQSPALRDIKVQNSPLWKADPDQQLAYYSGRALCRRHFPDVLLGIYDQEEIESGTEIGFENARDVTPSRKTPSTHEKVVDPLSDADPDHDPETGEVTDQADAAGDATVTAVTQEAASPDASAIAEASKPDPAKIALLEKLRSKAAKGADALRRGMVALTDAERESLTEAEHDMLGETAEAADRAKEPARAE